VPIITIIVGEGASGGALGIELGDRVYMLENTWYSVISQNLVLLFYGKAGNIKK
jgi:acetyl-CoA carboxylase alpha subunit